ncbi:hypothetical protein [Lactiplantibacillus plantarum]|uniref:hypothetical protein n=1 Tax=Lactiplantibacillus plantarum TaxID=1590 RepID=UPI00264F44F7|nr:hypothetical protein [Lactiplantibacillus plantarum]MDN7038288.1 hypothetical protein [Lactiplantibacillus plantarum]
MVVKDRRNVWWRAGILLLAVLLGFYWGSIRSPVVVHGADKLLDFDISKTTGDTADKNITKKDANAWGVFGNTTGMFSKLTSSTYTSTYENVLLPSSDAFEKNSVEPKAAVLLVL